MGASTDARRELTLPQALRLWITKATVAALLMSAAVLLPARDLAWTWAWVYVAITALGQVATTLLLYRLQPGLIIERVLPPPDAKRWDRPLTTLVAVVLPLVCLVICGLDHRLGWTAAPAWSTWLPWLGLGLALPGYALTVWAMLANAYFSTLVRIQAERDHRVASGGPYRWVRHPGYVGAMLFQVATPLLLGSAWGLLPALIACGLFVLRTALEDATLRRELDGYQEYTEHTRWRLLPGVW